ncbi:MAG TPA: GNAT family N-acetyltransferase [Mycobacteriales bacterium]|nr:GNAT family N-acetyltransferase [Mycobacteriales bacterium]
MRIEPADASSEESQRLLASYFAELARTFPAGFDPNAGTTNDDPVEISPPRGVFLVVRDDDGTAVGCGGLKLLDGDTAEIKRMWLDPATRGRGLGALLLDALEDQARKLGATEGVLDTNATLEAALTLYRLHGWREVPAYNDNPYATHWFAKEL